MDAIVEIVQIVTSFIMDIVRKLWDHYLDLNIFEKLIVITVIPAFLAVILPAATYPIWDGQESINNPLGVHLLGLVLAMFLTPFLPSVMSLLIRITLCALYLGASIHVQATHGISHAPYTVAPGFYINHTVPVLFVVFAVLSYFHER